VGKKNFVNRLTITAKIVIVVGVITLIIGGIFSIPSLGVSDRPDIGIFTDQLALSEDFVPFRIAGGVRTSLGTIDTSNTIDVITGSQVSELLKELPSNCGLKLQTTIVFDDGTRRVFSSGATSFAPVQTLSLVTGQGQTIKQFETVPLLRCPEVFAKDGSRHGYEHEWLAGVAILWSAYKDDGTLFKEGSLQTKGLTTPSKESDIFASILAGTLGSARPVCDPVTFADIGDLASAGYSAFEIKRWQETFGKSPQGVQATGIFIGNERAICAKDPNGVVADPFIITADELEQRIESAGKKFETTLIIVPQAGTSILEIPFLTQQLGEPFISVNGIDQFVTKQFLSFAVDNLSTQPDPVDITPPPTGITRTAPKTVSFNPVKIDIANLEDAKRTVTWRVSLNSYSVSEGLPNIVVSPFDDGSGFCGLCIGELFDSVFGGTTDGKTATIPMKDAGISGDNRIFQGKWIVQEGQSLGTYELKITMNRGSVAKLVEVVQSAENAPSEMPVNGLCTEGKQLVEDTDGNSFCVAECAGDLKYDIIKKACAQEGVCTEGLEIITKDDGTKVCGETPSTPVTTDNGDNICKKGLKFNPDNNKCEQESTTPIQKCKEGETLVNTGSGTSCIPAIPDFVKLLTPIACSDKIGFTDEGFCLPPSLVGLFQNPVQILYIGIAVIVTLLVLKFLFNQLTRQRGGLVLQQ